MDRPPGPTAQGTEEPALVLSPASPAPGEQFTVSFATSTQRGFNWNLERQVDDEGWETTHVLATGTDVREPTWIEKVPDAGLDEAARDGPGPDLLVLPDELPGGTYRITQGAEGDDEVRLEGPPFSIEEAPSGG